MSDMMDEAVINMPLEMAMSSEIACLQYHQRARQVLIEREAYKRWLAETEARLSKACELLKEASKRTDDYWSDGIAAQIDAFLKEIGHETN